MKKLLSIVMLFMMLSCICNAKTIVWDENDQAIDIKDKTIQITEQVEETKDINLDQILHNLQQYDARIAHLQELKANLLAELEELKSVLKIEEKDGVYTIKE